MDSQRRSWSKGGLPWTSVGESQNWGVRWDGVTETVKLHCNLTIYQFNIIYIYNMIYTYINYNIYYIYTQNITK